MDKFSWFLLCVVLVNFLGNACADGYKGEYFSCLFQLSKYVFFFLVFSQWCVGLRGVLLASLDHGRSEGDAWPTRVDASPFGERSALTQNPLLVPAASNWTPEPAIWSWITNHRNEQSSSLEHSFGSNKKHSNGSAFGLNLVWNLWTLEDGHLCVSEFVVFCFSQHCAQPLLVLWGSFRHTMNEEGVIFISLCVRKPFYGKYCCKIDHVIDPKLPCFRPEDLKKNLHHIESWTTWMNKEITSYTVFICSFCAKIIRKGARCVSIWPVRISFLWKRV